MSPTMKKCLRVAPVRHPVTASVVVPGSKSIGNRALLLAACSQGASELQGLLDSDDTRAALRALSSLGVPCRANADAATVVGNGLDFPSKTGDIDIGSSGTVGRFLPGLLAAAPEGDWQIVSTAQLAARPLRPLVDGLRRWGADLTQADEDTSFPMRVKAGGLTGGDVDVSAAKSSQFASGLLMAAPLCRKPASVRIHDLDPEETYIEMTRDLQRSFGVDSTCENRDGIVSVTFAGPLAYQAANVTIEADANTANYFLALAALTGGSVTVANLRPQSRQPGVKFLDMYSRLGAEVIRGEAVTVRGGPLPLRGGFSIDMRATAEMALTLGVMAAFADAPITMTNLAHIRGHESDRIAALAKILGQVGVNTDEQPDSITVHPLSVEAMRSPVVDPRDDHRLAMSFAVLGAAANGIEIENPDCVGKTCPAFFSMLESMGVGVIR